jgi:4-hydroxy-tetrahydrodipicolinate synthase
VALSTSLIGRLKAAYPDVIVGVKDSSGNWDYTEQLLRAHSDIMILIGDERHLARAVRLGAAGAISGLANVFPRRLAQLIETGEDDAAMSELVDELVRFPVTPAIKVLVADDQNDPAWRNVRSPLVPLSQAEAAQLTRSYHRLFRLQQAAR